MRRIRWAARPSAFSLVLSVAALLLGYVGWAGWEQGVRAARGEGTTGTFVASSLSCVRHPGHESCVCQGTFHPDLPDSPGSQEGAEDERGERAVRLHAADRADCVEGVEIAAVDAGAADRVYGPGGSREWVFSAVLMLVGGGGAVAVVAGRLHIRPGTEARDTTDG